MATYNGLPWLETQINSILTQQNVDVTIFVSDDNSSDGTFARLKALELVDPRVVLLPRVASSGSAGQNFYRLIRDVDIDPYDYVAYADQDDTWYQDKLIRHINLLNDNQASAVSSNVIAFWPDGRQHMLVKSQPQRKGDFLFESAGPGCSFLMTPWLVLQVREQLLNEVSLARYVNLHDWLTYAVCRALGGKWLIDPVPSLDYRQHERNVVGANSGVLARWRRLIQTQQGWYRAEVFKVSQVSAMISKDPLPHLIYQLTASKSMLSNLKLIYRMGDARRKFMDRLGLIICLTLFIF